MAPVEIVGYPDSDKIGAMAVPSVEAMRKGERWVRTLSPASKSLDYYEGEEVG